jgi:Secretion system C-terminal sorting domain
MWSKGQNLGFKYLSTSPKTAIFNDYITEITGKKYLCVTNDYSSVLDRPIPKLVILSESGIIIDSVKLGRPDKNLTVTKIISTGYGYCLLGTMRENNITSLWIGKLDKQFSIIDEKFESSQQQYVSAIFHTIDKDSTIIAIVLTDNRLNSMIVKIDKFGKLKNLKYTDKINLYPNSIMAATDSLRYFMADAGNWTVVDTSFNIIYQENLRYTDTISNAPVTGLYSNVIKKNDSTFYLASKCFWTRSPGKDLLFSTLNNRGKAKYLNVIVGRGDSSYQSPIAAGIDTSKDGRFIFYGATYNFDISGFYYSSKQSSFKLVKMDINHNIIWEKRYGDDFYYFMNGLLATSDGGCIMYGTRYNYNISRKTDGIIIKVDGNGVVTSTTSIPISQSSIIAYPNPSNGLLNFKKGDPSVSGAFEVNIFDISGKLVFQKRETDLSETFDLSHFAEGDYIYQIKQQRQIISIGKWVKIK